MKSKRYKLVITVLILVLTGTIGYACHHYNECDRNTYYHNNEIYNNPYGDCPCLDSIAAINNVLEDSKRPTSCVANNNFSLLRGGPLTFTSEDYGQNFSCYYWNTDNNKKDEIVEYGTRKEVKNMHLACKYVMQQYAKRYGLKCL